MSRILIAAALGVAFMLVSSPRASADGRFDESKSVYVNLTARYAHGSLSDTHHVNTRGYGSKTFGRNQSNFIGCMVSSYAGGQYVRCQADVNSNYAICYSYDQKLIDTARMINGVSYISFNWNDHGECTNLLVLNDSRYYNSALSEGQEWKLWFDIKNTIIDYMERNL